MKCKFPPKGATLLMKEMVHTKTKVKVTRKWENQVEEGEVLMVNVIRD